MLLLLLLLLLSSENFCCCSSVRSSSYYHSSWSLNNMYCFDLHLFGLLSDSTKVLRPILYSFITFSCSTFTPMRQIVLVVMMSLRKMNFPSSWVAYAAGSNHIVSFQPTLSNLNNLRAVACLALRPALRRLASGLEGWRHLRVSWSNHGHELVACSTTRRHWS